MEEDIDASHCHRDKQQEVSYNYTKPPSLQMISTVRQGVNTLDPGFPFRILSRTFGENSPKVRGLHSNSSLVR